jgi:ABC-type dipeptide/oligopeptide/nickel transport system permease subunit
VGGGRARRRTFGRNRGAELGAIVVAALVLFALLGPTLSPHGPLTSDFLRGRGPGQHPIGPSGNFLLGADILFRDEFVRLAYGARLSLFIGLAATAIATTIGAVVGLVAGYTEGSEGILIPWASVAALVLGVVLWTRGHGGWGALAAAGAVVGVMGARSAGPLGVGPQVNLDTALMRLVDVGLAFPFLLLVMAIGAALDRTTPATIMGILGITGWLGTARLIRSKALLVRNLDYVVAARALGASTSRIVVRHIVPSVAGPLIVIATVSVAQMIIAESVLSYLGAGVSPPAATWGQMLSQGQEFYLVAPWTLAAPAVAIFLAVFGFNLLGEGLRDALDPQED